MPTSVPAVVAVGDMQQVVLVNHSLQVVAVCLRAGDLISLHYDGDGPEVLTDLPFAGSKDKLGAVVVGDLLHLVWGAGLNVVHARWNMLTDAVDKAPTPEFVGAKPALTIGQANVKLLCHYVSATGDHESRGSTDGGDNWEAPFTIDTKVSTDVENVDVSISPLADTDAAWANTKKAT